MDEARSYPEWREAAIAHDKASGVHEWVESDESKYFDYVSIRRRLERLRKLRAAGDHERGVPKRVPLFAVHHLRCEVDFQKFERADLLLGEAADAGGYLELGL